MVRKTKVTHLKNKDNLYLTQITVMIIMEDSKFGNSQMEPDNRHSAKFTQRHTKIGEKNKIL